MRGAEIIKRLSVSRHKGRRQQPLKQYRKDFFRCIAHCSRIIDHQSVGVNALKKMGGGNIIHIKRRVLAHQHHIHRRQIGQFCRPQRKMRARLIGHFKSVQAGADFAVQHDQRIRRVIIKRMAARLRLQRQRKTGVADNVNIGNRVHLNGDFQRRL